MRKRFIVLFGLLSLVIGLIVAGLALMNPSVAEVNSSVVDPAQLPEDGLHLSVYPIGETNETMRVEIIGNVSTKAAGFDLTLEYPGNIIAPVLTDGVPAQLGDVFAGADVALNRVNEDSSNTSQIRIMYVFFGDSTSGAGSLAYVDFQLVDPSATNAVVRLVQPRLSRVNEAGQAEYVPLMIGEPTAILQADAMGQWQAVVGAVPTTASAIQMDIMLLAIGLVIVGTVGLLVLGTTYVMRKNRHRPAKMMG